MIYSQIQHALAQVKELQQKILERQRFKGYSGRARALSGTLALAFSLLMSTNYYPRTNATLVIGWGVAFLIGFLLNFGALIHWFLFDPSVHRDIRRLKPTLDALPAFAVSIVLTVVLILHNQFELLYGVWMSLFGLANLASRHVLPPKIWVVGWFYIFCGLGYLILSPFPFQNPIPVGLIFFIGEWAGGIILHFDDITNFSFRELFTQFLTIKEASHVRET